MDALKSVLLTIPWFAWIAIVAIISETVKKTICLSHRHRERMAMIQMGMNPDAPPDPSLVGYAKPAMGEEI
ncbi:MAG: hypothetical protein ACLQGP_02980 [Isosphaeraceae bacterium]